ncbi:SpoIID/LytB domain-containing protein [Irregularibacter muris]|uniref:SpoIID/LytB domain-containing protein n=1 Tax=Irregularibacter muris TaxID=1796619 RepID=A0AAE3HF89_9FIRM|nr:SpoIID/LytB domain-containing protein [Irregularibacter muris]MCR1899036.1 SpoIID/LytB domain-containing protein [Irregularibacter muris]
MNKKHKALTIFMLILFLFTLLSGCARQERRIGENRETPQKQQKETPVKKPPIPEQLRNDRNLVVYVVDEGAKKEIDIEEYVAEVLGGEMKNDWPEEALKAQAILARTFVMEFLVTKTSKYEGADVSTDIEEAQAWNRAAVNERIKKAVQETTGMVLSHGGQYVKAWFHAHAGGKTATAKEGLSYKEAEPPYIQVVDSPDSPEAPKEDAQWTAEFSKQEIIQAAKKMGNDINGLNDIKVNQRGPSGRALNLAIDGITVSAPELRIALGSTKLKSTFLTDIKRVGDKVVFSGKGYGHGVGMSQWGAYAMAKNGKNATEIIQHYFKDVSLVKLWD